MNTETSLSWIVISFDRHLDEEEIQRPVQIFVNGHSSHVSLETAEYCNQNETVFFCFSVHSSHVLQPCELSLFYPLKSALAKCEQKCRMDNLGLVVMKLTFASVFRQGWEATKARSFIAANGFNPNQAGLFW